VKIPLSVEGDSREPLYARLARQVRALIGRGTWGPGIRLPSVRRLVGLLGVSSLTILRAYEDLAREGFVEARPGAGFYVRARSGKPSTSGRREIEEALRGAIDTAAGYGMGKRAFLALATKLFPSG